MREYEAFRTFEETPGAIVIKSGAMAGTAVIGLLASGAGGFAAERFCQVKTKAKKMRIPYAPCRLITSVRDAAACLGPRFQTSVGKDGIA